MKRNMPVGVSDFKEATERYYLVDKTSFIQQFIDKHQKVTLFTRPRRFGKTLTLSMLDYFFSIDKKEDSKHIFDGLDIAKAGEAYMQYQGKYPVIFLTLKNVQSDSWDDLYGLFTFFVQQEYLNHDYILQSDVLSTMEKGYYERIAAGTAKPFEYKVSLLQLSKYLERYFEQKPIILIDEYDVPLQSAYEHGFYDRAIDFFRGWFNATLKDNSSLNFAVLTGVLRIAKESIFSGLNNLDVYSVLANDYGDVFGFTAEDIQKITTDYDCKDKISEIKEWYDGYTFGHTDIYNPWSVTNYISRKCVPDTYWANTSNNAILRDLLHQADTARIQSLQALMDGKTVRTSIDEGVIYSDIGQNDASLLSMMLNTGYLKAICKDATINALAMYDVKIPNKEVKQVYKREILSSLAQGLNINSLLNFSWALVEGDTESAYLYLQNILLKMVSFYDTRPKESFYHGLILGMTCLLESPVYHIESNRESGYGRFDLAVFPLQAGKAGVIMEFKVADSEQQLETKAQEALQQIAHKAYMTELQKRNVQHIWKYGIAFYGKHVKIVQSV